MSDYGLFDADNHYYEAEDAFTRHIAPAMARRCMQWAEIGGKKRLLVGGRVNSFIPNPTFDPIAKPGVLVEFFKGKGKDKDVKELFGDLEPIRPEYRDRDARLAVMDDQRIEAAWLFPTLGVGMEAALVDDPPAAMAAFSAFNRWLEDDWGYAYQERIFAVPYLCLADVDLAVAELERVLDRGARLLNIRTGPVTTSEGSRSPFTEEFDPVWARINEAGVTVTVHGGDGGYAGHVAAWEPNEGYQSFSATPLQRVLLANRPVTETFAAVLCHRLFDRHPNVRMASIENGASWVSFLMRLVNRAASQSPGWFTERPSETFKRHVWVSPFWEDDPAKASETIGIERTVFGSDWPHTEGVAEPREYLHALERLGPENVRKIMRDNARALTSPVVGGVR